MAAMRNTAPDITKANRWETGKMPSFKGKKAYILQGAFFGEIVALFAEAGFTRAATIYEADVVVFAGGADIDPALYGHKNVASYTYPERDKIEQWTFNECIKNNICMYGICRGAQLLHALNGGTLWQDVNNHGRSHDIIDTEWGVIVESTSIHHQMLQWNDKIEVIAECPELNATRFQDESKTMHVSNMYEMEIEGGIYRDTGCFFVQGHPEVGSPQYRSWCMTRFEEFFNDWNDHEKGSKVRHDAAMVIAERSTKLADLAITTH